MKHSLPYRIFRKDIGRKVTALLMALLVFAAFDKQTQVTTTVPVRIEYLEGDSAVSGDGWVLKVVQRSDPTRPLAVPPTGARPQSLELELQGTKETVDSLLESHQLFEFDPTEPGDIDLVLIHLTGIEDVIASVRSVVIVQPITLSIVVEESETLTLGRRQLRLNGTPRKGVRAPGPNDADRNALSFFPKTITLVGAAELVAQVLDVNNPLPLFDLDIEGRSGTGDFPLKLRADLEGQLNIRPANPRVEITFLADMEPLGDPIRKEVQLIRDALGLEQNPTLKEQIEQGMRLTFKAEEDQTRLIQVLRPRDEQRDAEKENLAREGVLLLAPWHHVNDLGRIRVTLTTVGSFPEGWEVRFADGEKDFIHVIWVQGDDEPSTDDGSDDEQ